MRPFARASRRLAMTIIALGLLVQGPGRATAAENWDLYIYNPVEPLLPSRA